MEDVTMNHAFNWCVNTLKFFAQRCNTTYEVMSIWLFCIIGPCLFLLMTLVIAIQLYKLQVRGNIITQLKNVIAAPKAVLQIPEVKLIERDKTIV